MDLNELRQDLRSFIEATALHLLKRGLAADVTGKSLKQARAAISSLPKVLPKQPIKKPASLFAMGNRTIPGAS